MDFYFLSCTMIDNKYKPNMGLQNQTLQIRSYQAPDQDKVIEIWKKCGLIVPQNDPRQDIQTKLTVQPDLFLVGVFRQEIIGTVMAGFEGHRGWINYLAVLPEYQHAGFGQQLMQKAEILLKNKGCPKINLQVRTTNIQVIEFYKKLGFQEDDVVSLGKRILEVR